MLQLNTTLTCPDCGRDFGHPGHDTLNAGDPCPSDDCPSHMPFALNVVQAVSVDLDDGSIGSVGARAALKAMAHHWQDHLGEGHPPTILVEDIEALRQRLERLSGEIMRRIQQGARAQR